MRDKSNTITKIKIKMLRTVRACYLISPPGTILRKGEEYDAKTNKNGAISGLCNNNEWLGVKPGEFEFVEAPKWVLDIHTNIRS
jgi:hypothetical protein